ncbi:MAG: NADPH-dependent F420 reductase [Vulcanimicrobiaceae bacterium]
MNVGILGSGDVGKALARGFLSRGHQVTIGTRDPDKLAEFKHEAGDALSVGSFADTARFGEVVVLATSFDGTKSALDLAGVENFSGKVVIDATNPLKFEPGKPPQLSIGFTDSAGESVQRWLPDAKVVKAFNTVGNPQMVDPKFEHGPPTMIIAGNDAQAKKTVTSILDSFGWDVVDAGGIDESRYLESLAMLWVHTALHDDAWAQAFKLLRK